MNEIIKTFIGLLYFFSVTLSAQTLMVYEDKTAKRSVEEVLHGEDTRFAAGDGSVGLSDSVWWVKIPLHNDQNVSKRVFVVFPNPLTRSLRAYLPGPSGLKVMQSGYAVPVSFRDVPVESIVFRVELPGEARTELFVRVESGFSIHLNYEVLDEQAFIFYFAQMRQEITLLISSIAILILYNLFLMLSIRERIYGLYVLYLASGLSITLGSYNLVSEILPFHGLHLVLGGGIVFYMTLFLFSRELLREVYVPWMHRLTNFILLLALAHVPFLFLDPEWIMQIYATLTGFIAAAALTAIIIAAYRRGQPLAKYLLPGWGVLIFSLMLYKLALIGWLDARFLHTYSFGILFEGIVFSMVLAYRIRLVEQKEQGLLERYETLARSTGSYNIRYRPATDEFWCSQNMFAVYGIPPVKHPTKETFFRFLTPEGITRIGQVLEEAKQSEYVMTIKLPDGTTKYMKEISVPRRDGRGDLEFLVTGTDITEQYLAERKEKEHLHNLQASQKAAKIASWRYYPEDDRLWYTDELLTIFGLQTRYPTLASLMSFMHPDDAAELRTIIIRTHTRDDVHAFTFRLHTPGGELKHVDLQWQNTFDADGVIEYSTGTAQDITEKVQAENKQKVLLSTLQKVQRLAKMGAWVDHIEAAYYTIDAVTQAILEVDSERLTLNELRALIHPDDLRHFETAYHRLLDFGTINFNTFRIITASGRVKSLHVEWENHFDQEGRLTQASGYLMDITERVLAEQKEKKLLTMLQESQKISRTGSFEHYDAEGERVHFSEENCALWGFDQGEAVTMRMIYARIHPDDLEVAKARVDAIRRDSTPKNSVFRIITPHRGLIYIHANTFPLYDGNGRFIGVRGTHQDITDEKLLELELNAERRFLQSILDSAHAVIAVIDEDGTMSKLNRFGEALTGFDSATVASRPHFWLEHFIPDDEQPQLRTLVQSMDTTALPSTTGAWIGKGGETHMIEWANSVIRDDRQRYLVCVGIDVTDKVEMEKALVYAAEASRAKSEFLANMSHEIRTPLNGIIGLTDLTLKNTEDPTVSENLHKVLNSSRLLLGIINDILDYSKIEAGKLEIVAEPFSLQTLLISAATLFSQSIEAKGIRFLLKVDPAAPLRLRGDPLRISQILNNLLGNAVKFTSKGEIMLQVRCLEADDDAATLRFSVRDTGKGIAPEKIAILFEAFSQEDNTITRMYGGTGLGLSISRRLAELMGSAIEVHSKEGAGSEFAFTLQLGVEPVAMEVRAGLVGKRILVIDDHATESELIAELLGSWEVEAHAETDPHRALERVHREPWDYIVVDWKMPSLDGTAFIAAMQHDLGDDTPPVIMVSAHREAELRQEIRSQKLNVHDILQKPFTASALYGALAGSVRLGAAAPAVSSCFIGKVLLAEDNEINRDVATGYLRQFGCEVDTARHGIEAVEKAVPGRYDLILMDLHMPFIDGFEASRKIRERDTETPIVALSAAVMQSDKERSERSGMNGHLAKPIDVGALEAVLQTYLQPGEPSKSADVPSQTLPPIAGVDTQELLRQFGNAAMILDMLRKFVRNYAGADAMFDAALPIGTLRERLHALKGVSGMLRITDLYPLARDLHDSEDDAMILRTLPQLTSRIGTCIAAIRRALPAVATHNDAMSPDAARLLLRTILPQLEAHEMLGRKTVEDGCAAIRTLRSNALAQQFQTHVGEFDAEAAASLVRRVLERDQG